MVYVLDEADKLCGISYIDWSKRYSQIPKATCEQLDGQCDGIQIDFDCSLNNGKGNEGGVTPTPTPIPEEKVIDMACDWFYVTHITDEYDVGNTHLQKLKLSKFLYSDRDITVNQ